MKKAIILISGGLDSATVLALLKEMNYQIFALSFNYAQRHNIELKKVKDFIKDYNIHNHLIIDLNINVFSGSALTDKDIQVPKYNNNEGLKSDIPATYVPARNTIFLSYALAFAEINNINEIFLGTHQVDSTNYPDCRLEYLKSFENMANLATKMTVEGKKIRINAPLINMTKTEIVRTGLRLNVDYSKTISCYDPSLEGHSCGRCASCKIRLKAFEENNMNDPILYI